MAPLRLLLLKSRKVRVSSMDRFTGMVPPRLLLLRSSLVRFWNAVE
jgi:hypothetical protein